jgi:SAM-dependent methyltransferase
MRIFDLISRVSKRFQKAVNARIFKRWGTSSKKKLIWDEEFSSGQWDYIENTGNDPIYSFIEKYGNSGSILDLGCGSGNTGNELDTSKYDRYTGVDISENAIQRAWARSKKNCREKQNEYICADISLYKPRNRYDIILFRESIFYIPKSRIHDVLDNYSDYLKETGVFIVRMCDRRKYASIVRLIEKYYTVVDCSPADDSNIILVFR